MGKIRNITLGISILIHTTVIGVMNGTGWVGKWISTIPVKQKSELALEFVEIPEEIPESKLKKESKVISDKTVEAKDRTKGEVKERKAKAKEVTKGKQIAKASPQSQVTSPRLVQPTPEVSDKFGSLKDNQPDIPQLPVPEQPRVEYDIINIPEVSESIFSTPSEGPLTFETQAHKIGPYFKLVKRKIEDYWLRYLIFRYQNTAPQESEAVISFKILPSGEITGVSVLEYSGDILFRDFCVAAITNTAPFPPLPENLEKELKKEGGLNIVFTFRYR